MEENLRGFEVAFQRLCKHNAKPEQGMYFSQEEVDYLEPQMKKMNCKEKRQIY